MTQRGSQRGSGDSFRQLIDTKNRSDLIHIYSSLLSPRQEATSLFLFTHTNLSSTFTCSRVLVNGVEVGIGRGLGRGKGMTCLYWPVPVQIISGRLKLHLSVGTSLPYLSSLRSVQTLGMKPELS